MNIEVEMSRSQRQARNELVENTRAALAHGPTRYLMRWILDQAGIFEPAFTGNSGTFYAEGKRELGLEVIALFNEVDPYEFVRLMKEGADDVVQKRNEARKAEGHD